MIVESLEEYLHEPPETRLRLLSAELSSIGDSRWYFFHRRSPSISPPKRVRRVLPELRYGAYASSGSRSTAQQLALTLSSTRRLRSAEPLDPEDMHETVFVEDEVHGQPESAKCLREDVGFRTVWIKRLTVPRFHLKRGPQLEERVDRLCRKDSACCRAKGSRSTAYT